MVWCALLLIRLPKELAPSIVIMTSAYDSRDAVLGGDVREAHSASLKMWTLASETTSLCPDVAPHRGLMTLRQVIKPL